VELKDKIPRQIYREIKNLKGLLMLSYIFLVLLFLLPFLTWPGFGSTIFWSPLDLFLLENYPLWFIAFYSFVLGIAVEVPSAWLFARLYMTKISPHLLKEENKSRKISFMQFSLGIISCLPLIIMFLYFVVLDFNPLSLTLIYLAQLKGSSEKYYYGYLDMAVTSWFTSGILFTLFVASFYLRNLFLKKLEERGVEVRESELEGRSSFFKFFKFATMGATGFGLVILLFFLPIVLLGTFVMGVAVIFGGLRGEIFTFILIQMIITTSIIALFFILLVKFLKKNL